MPDGNAIIARRYFEDVLGGRLDVADEIIAEDIAFYGPNYWGQPIRGLDAFKGFVSYLRSAFPDLHFTIEEEVVAGDRIASRFMLYGTHEGEWMGITPTGKPIALPGVDLFRVSNGKIAEVRVYYDTLGLMQQLGVMPAAQVEA
jgi:steroid delta-isomerase-like uncharacterized protein